MQPSALPVPLVPAAMAPAHHVPIRLRPGQLNTLRADGESGLLIAIYIFSALVIACPVMVLLLTNPFALLALLPGVGIMWFFSWVSHQLLYWYVYGNSIRVTATQYPAIFHVVAQAADALGLQASPTVFIMHGHGAVELFIAKHFSRRGLIIITSNLVDDLGSSGDTRRLSMLVGRQLGHIAAGHFDWWFLKDAIGALFIFVHAAYWRRCHYTADRVGMMLVGDLQESKAALTILVSGKTLQQQTNFNEVREQRETIRDSWFAWIAQVVEHYPYMVLRICALDEFQNFSSPLRDQQGQPIQSFNIIHYNFYSATIGNFVVGNNASASAFAP